MSPRNYSPENKGTNIGGGVYARWCQWSPERRLNPQYDGIPSSKNDGLIVGHFHPDGLWCEGYVQLKTRSYLARLEKGLTDADLPAWDIVSWKPLTLSPSIHMAPDKGGCGLHGYIREGKWVSA